MYNAYSDNEKTCLTALCGFFSGIGSAIANYCIKKQPERPSFFFDIEKCEHELFDPILTDRSKIKTHVTVQSEATFKIDEEQPKL